jgi:CheY-like chemotaxis protein
VDLAESGEIVLDKVLTKKYDLVLLDLVLPEMSGIEVLETLNKEGKTGENLRVVVSSNLNDMENQEKAMRLGASGFIAKSQYNPSEFVKEVNRLMMQFHEQEGNEQRLNATNNDEIFIKNKNTDEKKRIVFIEDEAIFLDLFVEKLKNEGHELVIARTGLEGLEKIYSKKTDLIITDIMMPKMKGDEVVKRLKGNPNTNKIPIIALSASISDEEIKKIRQYGVKDFFVKTEITPSDLTRRVRELLK